MFNNSTTMKEQMVQNYIMQIDFTGDFSVTKMKQDLRGILHEIPAIDIKYKKEKVLTEDIKGNKIENIDEKVKSVIIAFSDGYDVLGNPKVHKYTYFIG